MSMERSLSSSPILVLLLMLGWHVTALRVVSLSRRTLAATRRASELRTRRSLNILEDALADIHSVHGASATGDGSTLELSVVESLFEHAFDRIDVGFGHTEEHHSIREHSDLKLRKRLLSQINQVEGAVGTAEGLASDAETADGMVKGSKNATSVLSQISDDAGTAPDNHNLKFDLKWEVTNKTFKPDEFLSGLPVGYSLQNIANLPLDFTCKKCMTRGEIVLSQGNIQIDTAALKGIPDMVKKIPGMIASAVPSLINEIPDKVGDAEDALESKAGQAESKAAAKATSIVAAVPSKAKSIATSAVAAITSVADVAQSKISSVADAAKSDVESVVQKIIPTSLPDLNPFDRRTKMGKRGVDFSLSKVVTGGFVELQANGLEAYFELGAKPKSTGSFTFSIFHLPILGFTIPGVGQAGAILEALLEADYEFDGGFEMSYGMALEVCIRPLYVRDQANNSRSRTTPPCASTLVT